MNVVRIHPRRWVGHGIRSRVCTTHSCRYCQSYDHHCPPSRPISPIVPTRFRARHHPMTHDRPAERDDPRASRPPGDAPARPRASKEADGGPLSRCETRRDTVGMPCVSKRPGEGNRRMPVARRAIYSRVRLRHGRPARVGVERWQMLSSFRKRD